MSNAVTVLRDAYERVFNLPPAAVEWLLMLFEAIQLFDDCADDDKFSRDDLDSVIWSTLVAMPSNAFFLAHHQELASGVANLILKWQASDAVERSKQHNEVSFVWRAGYYDLVLTAIRLCHGPAVAHQCAVQVMQLYGEKYADYAKEFGDA